MSVRFILVFTVILFAILALLGVLGVVGWDDLSNHGGKLLLAVLILGGAGLVLSQMGPKKQSPPNSKESNQQGPQF